MPSVLGKRKRPAQANGVNGHDEGIRQTIIQTVEEQIELERSMKLKEVESTEVRIAWARAIAAALSQESSAFFAMSPRLVERSALLSYWSIGSAYYAWPKPHFEPSDAAEEVQPDGEVGSAHTDHPSLEFPTLTDADREAIQFSLANGLKPLLVRYLVAAGTEEALLFLSCPVCDRKDLTSVQGLYNHCRLAHQLTWAGHSECIEACGALVTQEDARKFGIEDAELMGTIPSLRRLFQHAVGVTQAQALSPAQREPSPSRGTPEQESRSPTPAREAIESYANVTLGVHNETPGLAPFLGTTARRREIRSFDVQHQIDIEDDGDLAKPFMPLGIRPRWRLPKASITEAVEDRFEAIEPSPVQGNNTGLAESATSYQTRQQRLSRFYISRRVNIKDRSCYVPPGRRPVSMGDNAYLWTLTISAPSYMPPLSTFLKEAKITLPTDEDHPIILIDPPFQAEGQTKEPFLARVCLTWAGDQNRDTNITHWVEVEIMHLGGWVEGEEQVLNVNLDKDTVFLPVRHAPARSKLQEAEHEIPPAPLRASGDGKAQDLPLDVLIQKFIKRFPLTMEESRPKALTPYFLPEDKGEFLELPLGRQKAIEWHRARVIRLAILEEQQFVSDIPLTTAAVFKRLNTGSLKRALEAKEEKGASQPPRPDLFCAYCGALAQVNLNRMTCRYGCPDMAPRVEFIKSLTVRRMDGQLPHMLSSGAPPQQHGSRTQFFYSGRDVIEAADPTLTMGMLRALSLLRLPSFPIPVDSSPFPLDCFGLTHRHVDHSLAPYALLAHVAKAFIRRLVARSVQLSQVTTTSAQAYASSRIQDTAVNPDGPDGAGAGRNRRARSQMPRQSPANALTPAHVLYALSFPAWDAPYASGFDILTGHGLGDLTHVGPQVPNVEGRGLV